MGYRNLRECVDDLERTGQLVRIAQEIDPQLEAAEIQRRVYAAQGPAVYFERVRGCRFPMVSNLFGTIDRARFLFRDALDAVSRMIELKADPTWVLRHPFQATRLIGPAWSTLIRRTRRGPATTHQTTLDQLPQLKCWPDDGGSFITLPAVYTEHPDRPGFRNSNLGMYRVQISGGRYLPNREVGLHYQIHRSIGLHHAAAIEQGRPLRVNILVGGPPSIMLSAVMPLPDGIPELAFAGAIGRRPVRMIHVPDGLPIYSEADFCISGTIDPDQLLPEGPFGDHLGYYSLAHDFPVLKVDRVSHRPNPIWPFTVVGRPPQEDTSFGQLIHELTGPAIPTVVAGVHAVHAVDAAGVHPLLLAIGSERYVPYAKTRRPQELLTNANAILGQGQLSLAKYLLIVAREDNPQLDIHDIAAFLRHVLERADWRTDLHFQTATTIDTLDYTGTGLNSGSKLVIAVAGEPRRTLPTELPGDLTLPAGFQNPRICLPGIMAVSGPQCTAGDTTNAATSLTTSPGATIQYSIDSFCAQYNADSPINRFPLIAIVDDSSFVSESMNNLLWVLFTRSNPAADVHGIGSSMHQKHWGCRGSLIIDARIKPRHAPPLIEDPAITRRVNQLATAGGPLHGIL